MKTNETTTSGTEITKDDGYYYDADGVRLYDGDAIRFDCGGGPRDGRVLAVTPRGILVRWASDGNELRIDRTTFGHYCRIIVRAGDVSPGFAPGEPLSPVEDRFGHELRVEDAVRVEGEDLPTLGLGRVVMIHNGDVLVQHGDGRETVVRNGELSRLTMISRPSAKEWNRIEDGRGGWIGIGHTVKSTGERVRGITCYDELAPSGSIMLRDRVVSIELRAADDSSRYVGPEELREIWTA